MTYEHEQRSPFWVELPGVQVLSRMVYEHEDPDFDVDEWIAGAHPLDDHALEHPLVTELVAEHGVYVFDVSIHIGDYREDAVEKAGW